ncbi:ephrin type-B receptor 1 isoform X4 [Paramuricea clavata]|uniref:Ephrin type-B receptor 1 isoform X4 n=1 Tax=Paramuricea clavata TaxID=317549 RepID=A0A6S7HNB1_PARCT|nr:ephrin type-B receptor 1 isoform X4 [Paramuricea clavata]
MFRAECSGCKNQNITVYILRKALPKETKDKEAVGILKNLTLVATLGNQVINTARFHEFYFEPKASQFFLVFLSAGSCTRIQDIRLSYFICDNNISSGVKLSRTVAPVNGSQRVNVSCPVNTLNPGNEEAYGLCSSKGIWEIKSPCMCKKGYTLNTNAEGCIECPINTYKDTVGNGKCTPCPRNSGRNLNGQVQCVCYDSFYRFQGENHIYPCYNCKAACMSQETPIYRVPPPVKDVKFIDKTETSITLQWTPPPGQGVMYDIKCNKCPSGSDSGPCVVPCGRLVMFKPSQNNLTRTSVTIQGLDQDTEYEFVIYSKNMNSLRINRTNWKSAMKKIKTEGMSKSGGLPAAVIIVVPVVVTILMINIIIIFVICLFKRRKTSELYIHVYLDRLNNMSLEIDISLLYVDPITYDNPERALSEFAKQLDRNLIKFGDIVGGGEFGDVYKGEMKLPEQPATKVAIKTLKPRASHKNRTDFLIEASVMGQFKNLNVITLEGVVTKSTPSLIVTEFMENGSLDKYLKENDGMLNPLQLLGMARGVASGMEGIGSLLFSFKDLAARNVLVNDNLACKVADFGLSRDLDNSEDSEYESQGGKIAVRWTAPEAITDLKFSTASDIWSYGIVLWEIMSFAERPYRNWRNGEVLKVRIASDVNCFAICPKTVHELMKECWMTDGTKRPPFKEIVRIIDVWIKYPEKLNEDYINVRRIEPLDNSTFTSVNNCLINIHGQHTLSTCRDVIIRNPSLRGSHEILRRVFSPKPVGEVTENLSDHAALVVSWEDQMRLDREAAGPFMRDVNLLRALLLHIIIVKGRHVQCQKFLKEIILTIHEIFKTGSLKSDVIVLSRHGILVVSEWCTECPVNTYKDTVGNGKCTPCPRNSTRNLKGQVQCVCYDGFYRFQGENHTYPCYGVPSPVREIKFIDKTETSITLQWTPPSDQGVMYDIKCNKCPSGSDSGPCVVPCGRLVMFKPSQNNLTQTTLTIQGLDQDTEYQFVIYSKNMNSLRINRTNWKSAMKRIKTEEMSKSSGLPAAVVIVVPVVGIILMIIILILVICLFKRRKIRQYRASQRLRGGVIPLMPGVKNYIDPTTYDNPERAVSEFAKELDRNLIQFEAIIGGGEFGNVYKGEMNAHSGQPPTKVAIKTLKAGASSKDRTDFLIEASVMGQFKNLNVITLEGVVTKSAPLLIVTEFMENGSLDRYLKENDGVLKAPQLLGMARGVASGMEYLAGMHFVHRV